MKFLVEKGAEINIKTPSVTLLFKDPQFFMRQQELDRLI